MRCQKLHHGPVELRSLLNIWHMAALIENDECGVWNLSLESLPIAQRDKTVFPPPDDQCRLLDCLCAVVEKVFAANHRLNNAVDCIAIARPDTLCQHLSDDRIGNERLVIENLT